MATHDISSEEIQFLANPLFIDVRSPGEWREGNIPNSINIPLLDDQERAEVGTVYKNVNPKQAKELAFRFVAPKLPDMTAQIKQYTKDHSVVIYCWRGGLRSKGVATILDLLDIRVNRLHGGYKEYRHHILNRLEAHDFNKTFIVLHGLTGVGKTVIIENLEMQGVPTLNLEGLAGHRGSSFGAIGLHGIHSQKQFDSLLVDRMDAIGDTPYYVIEAESRRIGKVMLPQQIMEGKEKGIHFIVEAPLEIRIDRILEEYTKNQSVDEIWEHIAGPITSLQKQLQPKIYEQVVDAVNAGQLRKVIEILMVDYYDHKYMHKAKQYQGQVRRIDATSIEEAVIAIRQAIAEEISEQIFA